MNKREVCQNLLVPALDAGPQKDRPYQSDFYRAGFNAISRQAREQDSFDTPPFLEFLLYIAVVRGTFPYEWARKGRIRTNGWRRPNCRIHGRSDGKLPDGAPAGDNRSWKGFPALSTDAEEHSADRLLPESYIGDTHESKTSISQGEPTNRRRTKHHRTERQLADGFP